MIAQILIKPFGTIWQLKHLCQHENNKILKKIYIFIYQAYQYENNSSIAWNSKFHGIPCLPHGIKGIFISGGAEIGKNCVIFQQVTIGSNTLPDSKQTGAPIIGNSCYVAAGAKIIGGIKVGNNVRIGANAVVYKDVPDNSIVVSGKQQIISKDIFLDNKFYSYHGRWVFYDDGIWKPVIDIATICALENKGNS